jgi:hypothetical protein
MVKRYRSSNPEQKTILLNEYCRITHYHRKHAIRKLRHFKFFTSAKSPTGRPRIYDQPVYKVLRKIWLAANLPCGKRLKPIITLWLPSYSQTFGAPDLIVIKRLQTISAATIDRIFKPVRPQFKKRGYSATRSGTLLRKQIPIQTNQWDQSLPGFIESDTVHHCGQSMAGQYVVTLNCDDIASGWTEQRAVWGKNTLNIFYQIKDVEKTLPFPILGFDSDNGGEFINKELFNYFTKRPNPVQFTRSRAYHTQDNAHIEQKNYTHIRQWLGYSRFDNPQVVPLLNDLYKTHWRLLHNFFCPSVKLIEKKRVGSKIIKRYDKPKTPYQRLLESNHLDSKIKERLKNQFDSLNPFELRSRVEDQLKKIFKLANQPYRYE